VIVLLTEMIYAMAKKVARPARNSVKKKLPFRSRGYNNYINFPIVGGVPSSIGDSHGQNSQGETISPRGCGQSAGWYRGSKYSHPY
jgi:hypothetical protein